MSEPNLPSFEEVLEQVFSGIENEDVEVFYQYFDQLRSRVRSKLISKARTAVGESAILHSALLSMFADVRALRIPLTDVDADGRPMLWPLLLKYIERHCNKWNSYYRAAKVKQEFPIGPSTDSSMGYDPAAKEAGLDEEEILRICEQLNAQLTQEEQAVFEDWVQGKTIEESAQHIDCSESKISYLRKRVRDKMLEQR